jgi:hypothetical protein
VDTRSRVIILSLTENDVLSVRTGTPVASDDEALITSWGGFHIEPALNSSAVSIFSATTEEGGHQSQVNSHMAFKN